MSADPSAAANPSAATEHTGEPQLAGYAGTHAVSYYGNATEHADAGPCSGDLQIVAIEPDDAPDILFTSDEAAEIRRTFQGQAGKLHTEARKYLNEITDRANDYGGDEVYFIGDAIRWKNISLCMSDATPSLAVASSQLASR